MRANSWIGLQVNGWIEGRGRVALEVLNMYYPAGPCVENEAWSRC